MIIDLLSKISWARLSRDVPFEHPYLQRDCLNDKFFLFIWSFLEPEKSYIIITAKIGIIFLLYYNRSHEIGQAILVSLYLISGK